jgi:uncharacterized protein (DUF362 family)
MAKENKGSKGKAAGGAGADSRKAEMPRVDVRKMDKDTIPEALSASLEAIGYDKIVKSGDLVVIKVNATHYYYLPGLTVNPDLVYHFVKLLKDKGCKVIVGEGDLQRVSAETALKGCGIDKAARKAGAKVVNFCKGPRVNVDVKGEYFDFNEYKVPKYYVDADVFASMPVFKTHKLTQVTLTLKNHFGCVPDDLRLKYHGDIHKVLSDFCQLLNPKLVVMDGIIGLESDGPIAGLPKKLGLVLTATNAVAADAVACNIMGFDPKKVQHINNAFKRGLGPIDLKQISLSGEPLKKVRSPFEKPNADSISKMEKWISPHPLMSHLVYRTFFKPAKWVSWKWRGLTGYKRKYIERIKKTGLWDDYDNLFH